MGNSPGLVQLGGVGAKPNPAVPPATVVSVDLAITGMTCAGCAHNVELALGRTPGVAGAQVNFATRRATVRYIPDQTDPARLRAAVQAAGYGVAAPSDAAEAERAEARVLGRKFILSAILSAPVVIVAMSHGVLHFHGSAWLQLALTTPVIFYCGSGFFASAWKGLLRR
ncbi:MAG: cation transporter, partial [Acidobacteria bacterium]|nr:cation transporter [Acidobacteriota bacterium]